MGGCRVNKATSGFLKGGKCVKRVQGCVLEVFKGCLWGIRVIACRLPAEGGLCRY